MKKYLYSLLFMAMAIVSAVSFVSCDSDDDNNPVKESYLVYKCWISNDALELADVVTDGISISLNTPATYVGKSGKEGTVEFTGKQVTDAKFTITLKLKSNWKEILAAKEEVAICYADGFGKTKGQSVNISTNVHSNSISKSKAGDNYESGVSDLINKVKLTSK